MRNRIIAAKFPQSPAGRKRLARTAVPAYKNHANRNIVYIFSSQGTQWPGMGRHLFDSEPVFQESIIRCSNEIERHLGWSLLDGFTKKEKEKDYEVWPYNEGGRIQPAVTAVQIGLSTLIRSRGIQPMAVAGLSMGEVSAAYAADILSLEDAMLVVCCQARLTRRRLRAGRMAYVHLSQQQIKGLLPGFDGSISIAVELSPTLSVLSGEEGAIKQIVATMEARQIRCGVVNSDFAFHSPEMLPLEEEFLTTLRGLRPNIGSLPVYSSVTGELQGGKSFGHKYWWQIMVRPAHFLTMVNSLLRDSFDVFAEIGPHPMLLSAISETASLYGKEIESISVMRRGESERKVLQESLQFLKASSDPQSE